MLIRFNKYQLSLSLLFICGVSASSLAQADALDALNFSLGAASRFEDNLFRLSDDTNTKAAIGKSQRSDQVWTTNAGIKFDKTYSLQRVVVDAKLMDNRYNTYSYLDYTAFNYHAAWLWAVTPNITGTLSADQTQVLNSFSEFRDSNNNINKQRSIQTNETRVFNVDGLIGGGVHLLGGLTELRSRNSTTFNAVGDFIQTTAELGVKYVAPSENWGSLIQRASVGDYQGRIANSISQLDTGFKQRETEARVNWRLTGKSLIDAKLGYLEREHDNFSSRDYNGMTGKLAYIWTPTDKLRFNTSIARNLYSYQQFINSYYVADSFSMGPIWQISAKTSLRLNYDFSEREYLGAIAPVAEKRKDHVQMFMLEADWMPRPTITVSGILQRETRNSNFNNINSAGGDLSYEANSAIISAQLLF